MRVRTMMIIGLFVILGGASEQQADSERQEPVYLDILGRLNVASGFARAGGFFDAPGNSGMTVDVRNWDPQQSVESLRGLVGFAPGTECRITGVRAFVPGGRSFGDVVVNPERSDLRLDSLGLSPGETLRLEITLSSTPPRGYVLAFEAKY